MKWAGAAATYRRSISEALTAINGPARHGRRQAGRRTDPARVAPVGVQHAAPW
jgi:hypothetical protein